MRQRHPHASDVRAAPGLVARLSLALASGAVLASASACAAGDAGASELLVAAASSLREPLSATARRFEAAHPGLRVQLAFGASSVLALQARAGAPIDVLVSADARIVEELAREGRIGARGEIARNRLVVIASREAAPGLRGPGDLASDRVRRIALPEAAVPIGRYAREWLAAHALLGAVEARAVRTEHARATLVAVEQGQADAAIVYATDARLLREGRLAFEIPDAEQPRIAYIAAVLLETRQPQLASAFLAALRASECRALLRDAGFGLPAPDAAAEAP
ncbi:MAG: molybdate ABC transporter substrate-binding protein [Myxococcales bacterium]|nr:molybdate ABC transporter substrate-binding protein [Myxococcales bacterium]MDH5305624.1 molybdate ABC transporter substrate-binding protein [Myxococcales bacterium]